MKKFNPTLRNSRGYGLMEALIVAVCIAVGIAAIYTFYQKVYATQEAHEESQNVAELTNRIMKAYGPMANFTGLSTSSVINEGVVPSSIGVSGGDIISSFGGNVVITPQDIDGIAGAGFGITYHDVPKNQCSKLVASVNQLQRYRAITVAALGNGNDNGATIVAEHGRLNEQVMSAACNSSSRLNVTFVYQKTDNATAASELDLCVAPSPENRTISCPSGYLGSISETRVATCDSPYGLPSWGAWTETSNTCNIVCMPDPTSPATESRPCPNPSHIGGVTVQRTSTCSGPTGLPVWSAWTEIANTCGAPCIVPSPELNTQTCPAGQIGIIRLRRVATCPDPVGIPLWGGWTEYENTCQDACVLPTPSTELGNWRPASEACPHGYSGNVSWEYEQERTATCPQATGSYIWSEWRATGRTRNRDESQCVSLCSPDSPLERWVPATGSCPAGHTGTITFEARETRTSICTRGATTPTTSTWQRSGEVRNEVNTCVAIPSCQLPNPSRERTTQMTYESNFDYNACPAGQEGYIHFRRTIYQESFRTASCPNGATAPVWSNWGTWTTYSAEPWWIASRACVNSCTPESGWAWTNPTKERLNTEYTGTCPAGQKGEIGRQRWEREQRQYTTTCPGPTTTYSGQTRWVATPGSAGEWRDFNNCRAYRECNLGNFSMFWNGPAGLAGPSCRGSSPGAVVPHGGTITIQSDTTPGQATYRCTDGVFGQPISSSCG